MPYWRLSGFYFFYFAALGGLIPYWGLYLKSLGFVESDIGELIAIILATKIVAPNVWGWIADHTGKGMMVVRIGSLLAAVCFAGIFLGSWYWWLALVMATFSFFWNASLPQFEVTTMNHLGKNTHQYSAIRLWGSIGFIVTVASLGSLFEHYDINLLPVILLVLFTGIWVNSLMVPENAVGHLPIHHQPLREVLGQREVVALLLVCFLVQASHGPYYTFYSIYLDDNSYSRELIGWLWALAVLAEIVIFLMMYRILPQFGSRKLLLFALAFTTLRWLLIASFVENISVLVFAQILHAASFGIVHAVAIHLIHKFFTGKHQGKGQALYSSLSFGAGGAIGSLYSGYLWSVAGPEAVYVLAACFSIAAFFITWKGIHSD